MRGARLDDAPRLLQWRNDPVTRAASRSMGEVTPGEHETWLAATLADPRRHLLVGEVRGTPVGQVRFDELEDGRFEISVGLASEARGRGIGSPLIAAGVAWLRERTDATIVAEVREENESSLRAFARVGFSPIGQVDGWSRLECGGPAMEPASR